MKCPRDIAVVGFDDQAFYATTDPALTSVSQPSRFIGENVARTLWDLMQGQQAGDSTAPYELVVRSSCGCGGRR